MIAIDGMGTQSLEPHDLFARPAGSSMLEGSFQFDRCGSVNDTDRVRGTG